MIEKFKAKSAKLRDWEDWLLEFESVLEMKPKWNKNEESKLKALRALGGAELIHVLEDAPMVIFIEFKKIVLIV